MNPLDFLLRNPSGRDAGSIARQRLNARTVVPRSGGGVPRATGGFLANPIFAAYAIPGYSEQKSRNATGVIEGTRGPLNELQYIGGQLLRGRMPYGGSGVGSIPPSANGESYRRAELRLADAARPGGGGGGGGNAGYSLNTFTGQPGMGSPADRAYQQELSRTAQLTAQDPELQRYETARAAAKTQEEMNSVRDMGLAMWQERYGKTAMGQPGGAIGSINPLMRSTFGYQTGMAPGDIAQTITNPAAIPVSPGEAPYQTGDLGTGALADTGYDTTRYGVTPERIEEIKKQLLVKAGAK